MKKELKGMIAGILIGSLITNGLALAKSSTDIISAVYNNIKIYVDGVKIDPKDASGNTVEPFIYNGTTYLPVRAVGEAIGKTVTWDGETQSIYLGKIPGINQGLLDVCKPYDGTQYSLNMSEEGKHIVIGGQKYTDAITYSTNWWSRAPITNTLFNLDGKYKSLSFEVGRVDGSNKEDATLNIYLDNNLEYTFDLNSENVKQKIDIDLKNALCLKIEFNEPFKDIKYGIINSTIN